MLLNAADANELLDEVALHARLALEGCLCGIKARSLSSS
jgi:hypothetical protein